MKKYDDIRYELYSYDNKISRKKCFEMLEILVKFYNDFNGMDNGSKEVYNPWIKMIRNTKDYYILLCYKDNVLIGFLTYMYQDIGLMLSEAQIREEYQNKGYFKKILKEVIMSSDISKYKDIYLTIHKNNIKSQEVFKHIGFKLVENTLYKISYEELLDWLMLTK